MWEELLLLTLEGGQRENLGAGGPMVCVDLEQGFNHHA